MKLPLAAVMIAACTPRPPAPANIENAAAVAQYAAMLEGCREKGKASNSYAVYKACADEVDAHLCQAHGLRCPEGVK